MSALVNVVSNEVWQMLVKMVSGRRLSIFTMHLLKRFDLCWDLTTIKSTILDPTMALLQLVLRLQIHLLEPVASFHRLMSPHLILSTPLSKIQCRLLYRQGFRMEVNNPLYHLPFKIKSIGKPRCKGCRQ